MVKTYLLSSIDEWVGICDCENDQENITMRVGKGPQFGIFFLSGSVPASKSSLPQAQINKGAINFYCCSIVVENCWDVISWKLIFCIADQHTGLAYASISHSHYLNWNRVWHIMNIWSNYTIIFPLLYYHIKVCRNKYIVTQLSKNEKKYYQLISTFRFHQINFHLLQEP